MSQFVITEVVSQDQAPTWTLGVLDVDGCTECSLMCNVWGTHTDTLLSPSTLNNSLYFITNFQGRQP